MHCAIGIVKNGFMKTKCKVPECTNTKLFARGLCRNHYQMARNLVSAGVTTWDKLVDAGKANQSYTRKASTARNWFLDNPI